MTYCKTNNKIYFVQKLEVKNCGNIRSESEGDGGRLRLRRRRLPAMAAWSATSERAGIATAAAVTGVAGG